MKYAPLKRKTTTELTAKMQLFDEQEPEGPKPTRAQLRELNSFVKNDPNLCAQENLAIAKDVQGMIDAGGHANVLPGDQMVYDLVTDPQAHFERLDTGMNSNSGKSRALVKALTKKFLKDHPDHGKGYIGKPRRIRRRINELNHPDGEWKMARKTYSDEEKAKILKEAEATSVPAAAKKHGVTTTTIYNWKGGGKKGKTTKAGRGLGRPAKSAEIGGRLLSRLAALEARVAKLEEVLS